jgi:cytochrome c
MTQRTLARPVLVLSMALAASACGGAADESAAGDRTGRTDATGELTSEQMEKGIGPVRDLELEAFDASLSARGEEIFTLKCSACHRAADRYVGPALGDVLSHRTPEYVMNMMLNPAEMLEKHPEAKRMLAEYMTPMPNQNLTQEDARAVLEYLRSLSSNPSATSEE